MMRSWQYVLLTVTGAALLAGTAPAVIAQGFTTPTAMNPWTTLAPFPEPAEELLGATANGKLYIFCGLGPGWTPLALVYEYDPVTNTWTKKKPMALPSHHVAFASLNNKIYAFGGFKVPTGAPPAWDPIDNAW